MPKVKKIFIVQGHDEYYDMFLNEGMEIVSEIKDADLVVFTGGSDVSPSYYGETQHPKSYNELSRDKREEEIYKFCVQNLIAMVGICRGGQFLNCMNGGRMYQHVTNHVGNHNVFDNLSHQTLMVSSTHHQMMIPSKDAKLIAFANQCGIRERMEDHLVVSKTASKDDKDAEVVYYKKTKCLCFQPHPEFRSPIYDCLRSYFFRVLSHVFKEA